MYSTEHLKQELSKFKSYLSDVQVALGHDEYAKEFVFRKMDKLTIDTFKSATIKAAHSKMIDRNIGFDPNLFLQHIEGEILDQFNEIVKTEIKGKSIPTLMEMRHELEVFLLKDRETHYKKQIEELEKKLLEATTGVSVEEPKEVVKKAKKK